MDRNPVQYSFGPVPSRRLGRSVGINNIPAKSCTYACRYCQVGRTTEMPLERRMFYNPLDLFRDVSRRVEQAKKAGETIEYLTFVPDGEPTLDIHLGEEIRMIKELGIPVAVITNSSLIWRDDVKKDLMNADWISLKVDSVSEEDWFWINRPHRSLNLAGILEETVRFASCYRGRLNTESMLLDKTCIGEERLEKLGDYLGRLMPEKSYLSVPIRPPVDSGAEGPDEEHLNRAFQIVSSRVKTVEYLVGYEGDAFSSTGDIETDLLAITAVHPMRREAVEKMIHEHKADWHMVESMLEKGELTTSMYKGHTYFMRNLKKRDRMEQGSGR